MRAVATEESFQSIVARELARAPWFLLSLALHALAILLANLILGSPAPVQTRTAQAEIVIPEAAVEIEGTDQPEETVELQEAEERMDLDEPQLETFTPEAKRADPAFDPDAFAPGFEGIGMLNWRGAGKGKGGSGGDDIFGSGSDALRQGALRTTVSRLRETGLEIVFVFDSTGSMDRVLDSAKRRIFRMVEVLHALVPRARIGIVTYRDRGKAEEYVTRSVPVTTDVYRVMNFMHTIDAGGGGDFAEAVLAGLRVATTQRWLKNSRRVVVLIGDAPPHKEEENELRNAVQSFARGQSFVHTIATTDGIRSREPNPDTQRAFAAIAQDGKGQYAWLEAEDSILRQVMALAFGPQHRRDLDEIYAIVDRRTQRTEVAALDAVQRGELGAVERGLRREPVDDEIIKAAIALPNPTVTRFLIEKLGDRGLPPHGRQACSFAVMQLLGLRQPPLDPESDEPLSRREVEGLARRL